MSLLERYFAPAKGAIREFVGVSAFLEPADLALYARLLPAPFAVPDQPIVQVMAVDYLKAVPWPLRPWREWGILLQCAWEDQIGWYPVTMPVTRWLPMQAGRYLGYPKHVADEISVTGQGDRWRARGVHRGVQQLALSFEPAVAHHTGAWEAALWSRPELYKGDVFLVVPPSTGSQARRVSFDYVAANWTTQHGTVHLEVDASESWAGLVPSDASCPGEVTRFVGGLNLVTEPLTHAGTLTISAVSMS